MVDPQLNQTVMNVFYYIREGADTAAYCTLVFGGACLGFKSAKGIIDSLINRYVKKSLPQTTSNIPLEERFNNLEVTINNLNKAIVRISGKVEK